MNKPKIDFSSIPKTILWGVIVVMVVLILSSMYIVFSYKIIKPYEKYVDVNCKYLDNNAVVILTAKQDIENITIYDFSKTSSCKIPYILKDSMDGCFINLTNTNFALARIYFNVNNKTMSAIVPCESMKRGNLLDLLKNI